MVPVAVGQPSLKDTLFLFFIIIVIFLFLCLRLLLNIYMMLPL